MTEWSDPSSPFSDSLPCPTSFTGHGALKTTEGKAEVPSLDKQGWLRPSRKCREASLAGADGHERSECEPDRAKQGRVVGSTSDNRWLERTTLPCFALSGSHSLRSCPSAPERNGVILLMARPPLLCQGGEFAFPLVVLKCPNSRHLSITTTPQSIHEPGLEYPMQTAGH